jgi:hypothetical protein
MVHEYHKRRRKRKKEDPHAPSILLPPSLFFGLTAYWISLFSA